MQIYDGNKHQRELLISTICTADTVLTMLEEVAEEGWVTTKRIKVSVKVDKSKKTPEGTLANQVRAFASANSRQSLHRSNSRIHHWHQNRSIMIIMSTESNGNK